MAFESIQSPKLRESLSSAVDKAKSQHRGFTHQEVNELLSAVRTCEGVPASKTDSTCVDATKAGDVNQILGWFGDSYFETSDAAKLQATVIGVSSKAPPIRTGVTIKLETLNRDTGLTLTPQSDGRYRISGKSNGELIEVNPRINGSGWTTRAGDGGYSAFPILDAAGWVGVINQERSLGKFGLQIDERASDGSVLVSPFMEAPIFSAVSDVGGGLEVVVDPRNDSLVIRGPGGTYGTDSPDIAPGGWPVFRTPNAGTIRLLIDGQLQVIQVEKGITPAEIMAKIVESLPKGYEAAWESKVWIKIKRK